jgi:AMP deaminase
MYYVSQFGMALCPLSNDKLFLKLKDSPIGLYHRLGMNISLNTDDPLQFHSTADPIAEEYLLSAKAFDLNDHDLGEIATNSVRMSNFDHETKADWHGNTYYLTGKVVSNQPDKTNVTDIRSDFRDRALRREHKYLLEKSSRNEKFQELLAVDNTGEFVKIGKYRVRNTYFNKQDELSEENTEKETGTPTDQNMKFEE